jgi:aspartate/methionine/tyrosine aminotransferase
MGPKALRASLRRPGSRVRAVTVVSPSNPSGAVCARTTGSALVEACVEAGAWLLSG